MKTTLSSILTAVLLLAFTANISLLAQNKETKGTENKVKTTVQKVDTKKEEVKQTTNITVHKNHKLKKGGVNTVKNEVKTELGKETKKMNNDVKKNEPLKNIKTEKNTEKKIKN